MGFSEVLSHCTFLSIILYIIIHIGVPCCIQLLFAAAVAQFPFANHHSFISFHCFMQTDGLCFTMRNQFSTPPVFPLCHQHFVAEKDTLLSTCLKLASCSCLTIFTHLLSTHLLQKMGFRCALFKHCKALLHAENSSNFGNEPNSLYFC